MKTPTIALAVPWCPWLPERAASMARLRYELGVSNDYDKDKPHEGWTSATCDPTAGYREFGDKLPNDQWSEQVFTWLAETGADWTMQIQEDALLVPNFWAVLRAVMAATPPEIDIIGLHSVSPVAERLVEEGVRLYTTSDALVGVAWLVRTSAMRDFVAWRKTKLLDGWRTPTPPKGLPSITEDTMIGLWALATGRKVLHQCPAVVDHDVSMASVWGNDDHQNRKPRVRWDDPRATWTPQDLEDPSWWQGGTSIPHLGRHYSATPMLARRWMRDLSEADHARMLADDGRPVLEGLRLRMLARHYQEPKHRLFLGTPHQGSLHPEYAMSVLRLSRVLGLDVFGTATLEARFQGQDLVRARSRMVRVAYEAGATHLLFVDSDCAFEPEAVMGMVRSCKDFISAPYLRRDGRGYTIKPVEEVRQLGSYQPEHIDGDTVEIEGTGLGLTLISRACMERMLTEYRGKGLDYIDMVDGQPPALTTALFMPVVKNMTFLGEDIAFAQRWRDLGGKVHMYIGPGAPIAHYGEARYQGRIEDLGFERRSA